MTEVPQGLDRKRDGRHMGGHVSSHPQRGPPAALLEELKLTSSGWSQAVAWGRSECIFLVARTTGREF